MPKLIRLYITNTAIGFALGAVFVGMLLWYDIADLWHLISTSDKSWLAFLALWIPNGMIFAGVQFAIAEMNDDDDDDDDDDGPGGGLRGRHMTRELIPIPVPADPPRSAFHKKR